MKCFLNSFFCSLFLLALGSGCSSDEETLTTPVRGTITVADSVGSSGNYSGISITIINKDSSAAEADTLYHSTTDREGGFSGIARFPKRGQYAMLFSRNEQPLVRGGIILSPGDTVNITGELPGLAQTLKIRSKEHDALALYNRVERNFQRVTAFARAGRLKGDSLVTELRKWPDIFWQVYQEYPESLAGGLGAKRSIELLSEWDPAAMMHKIRQIQQDDDLVFLAATHGKNYLAQVKGLDYSLSYLDSLKRQTDSSQELMRIQMERINLLYDSARVEEARKSLADFKNKYKEDEVADAWAESMTYDLEYLSPGDAIPEFSFRSKGKEISRENLKGKPYLLEITPLANPLYLQQYDRSVVIYNIYKNYNFEIVTIPLDTSQVTINAFFEERIQPWPVAPANAFDRDSLIKTFNIQKVPVRFLVDSQGRIARRYIGREYTDVIQGIQQIMNTN